MATRYSAKVSALNAAGGSTPGALKMECGEGAFTTTGLTVEIPTELTTCVAALITPVDPTASGAAGDDIVFCDRVVTTGAITVSREDDGTSGMKFNYLFYGV